VLDGPLLASYRMAHVVFALGERPGLSQDEALEIAELLARRRSLAAQSASRKIRLQADPGRGEEATDIELNREELEQLEALLAEERQPEELPRLRRLRDEIRQALREGPPPSGRLGEMRPRP
jgi:hypothetical protein